MNILQRILNNFSVKTFGGSPSWVNLAIGSTTVNEKTLLENNKDWVFVGVDKVAGAASSIRLRVMRSTNDADEELFDHPLNEFLYTPHPMLTGRDFVYLTFAYKDLTGNAFWRIEKIAGKTIITPLIPTKIFPVMENKDGTGQLLGYIYYDGVRKIMLLPDEVLHDRYPNPANPFWGKGALQRISAWVDTDTFATEFNKVFFENGASFGGMIESDALTEANIKLIKQGFIMNHTGARNAHKIGVLPKGAKWVEGKGSMNDMQFEQLSARSRDNILAGFGVPKSIAGIVDDVNRANAEASEYVFMKHTMKPKMDRFIDFLNMQVVPLFDKTGSIYIDTEVYIPINEEALQRSIEVSLAKQPYRTVNEVRSQAGLPPITGGDIVYGSAMVTPIGSPVKTTGKSKSEKRMQKSDPIENIASSMAEFVKGMAQKEQTTDEIDQVAHKLFVDRATDYEHRTEQKIQDFNQRQRNDIVRNIGRIVEKSFKVGRGDIFELEKEIGILVDLVTPIFGQLIKEQLIEEWERNRYDGEPDTTDERMQKVVAKAAKRLAESYNGTTAELITSALNAGIGEGEGLAQLTDRVNQVFEYSNAVRAKMVAHTETFYMANEGNREAYRQSGFVNEVRWYTSEAANVCEFCGPLNGKVIGITDVFYKKGDVIEGRDGGLLKTDYRTIDNPPLHPNCNCFIRAVPKPIKSLNGGIAIEPVAEVVDKQVDDLMVEIKNLLDL
ncbi:Phage head morphogenesis domain containing protein [uncultured Caudovirales phage]|uniref:Phage head morphogenesis domain containing protein n=1 Tax=uncultured Caudovirales phage TaxID=2100421 RepID=A0A6J5MZA3_9CAUD|nr:Phage head morphogenesis domain containing protein [uncultured Caudovirales phage]